MSMEARARGRVFLAVAERCIAGLFAPTNLNDHFSWQSRYAAAGVVTSIADLEFDVDRAGAFDLLLFISTRTQYQRSTFKKGREQLVTFVAAEAKSARFTEGERYVLYLLRNSIINGPPLGSPSEEVERLTGLIGDGKQFFLAPGEVWSDAVNDDLAKLSVELRQKWIALLAHLLTATAARPSDKWLKCVAKLRDVISTGEVAQALKRWLPLVSRGRSVERIKAYSHDSRSSANTINEENALCLRGMLWTIPDLGQNPAEMARLISALAVSAYKKVPGVGPRCVKVGNAAVYALSDLKAPEAVGQLAMLKARVKFGTAQKEIEKAFNASAEALSIPRHQIEEMGVPTYGMEEVGLRREEFGQDFRAELRVVGREVRLVWFKANGIEQKSVPASVKSEFGDDLKELQSAAKDIAGILPAQADRIDSLFLGQNGWPITVWRERYLDHPLVGTIARRLIWIFRHDNNERCGIWHDGQLLDTDGKSFQPADGVEVLLWHPLGRSVDEVLAWRAWLEEHQVRQPFKQAHREIYVLTDAEQRTRTYSNRFAAHIIRQHQFNALCGVRGWKNKLRLMVDDSYPPAQRILPQFNLRVEYWVEGIGGNYGQDTNETGVFNYLSTDQVRFYPLDSQASAQHAYHGQYLPGAAEPLPLERIPPLVFSEVMRDVDLFVGVCSVGNDPSWADGAREGPIQTYWNNYSFGALNETAKTRQHVLERLIPKLKIASHCSFDDKFLVVKGDFRTYKIHLGSGNILMAPNDQYLCIVAKQSANASIDGEVFLPFEGDHTLAVILSKAFLLANDAKIKGSRSRGIICLLFYN